MSLDVGFLRRRRPASPVVSLGVSLDLSDEPTATRAAPAAPSVRFEPPPRRTGRPGRPVVRVRPGTRTLLGAKTPAVTLDRLQSGIGVLAVASPRSGGPDLACAYELTDGRSALIGPGTAAPAASRTPLLAVRSRSLSVDLRQVGLLARLLVLAVFPAAVVPSGALVVTTWDGARLEVPLDQAGRVVVALSVHNLAGELVLRAEAADAGSPRAACAAYGFDGISRLEGTP
jgi:hypothetical protein